MDTQQVAREIRRTRRAIYAGLAAAIVAIALFGAPVARAAGDVIAGRFWTTPPTATRNGQTVDLRVGADGGLVTSGSSAPSTHDVYVNAAGESLTIQFAQTQVTSASATQVVASTASNQIVVVGFKVSASAACNVKWVDDTGGTPDDLSSLTYLGANGGWTAGYPEGLPARLYETTSGENLGIDSSTADALDIDVWYVTEPD